MDKQFDSKGERLLLQKAVAALGSYLGVEPALSWISTREASQKDAVLRLTWGNVARSWAVEVKIGLRPNNLGAVVHRLQSRRPDRAMLVTDYISPPLQERLREQGISYLDAVGNVWIQDPPLLLWISGRRRDLGIKTPATGRKAFQSTGLRVVFAMLCHPEWCNLPYRELAAHTGVAHGSVGHVMSDLTALGFMFEVEGTRRLTQRKRLLQQWAEAYPRSLRPGLGLGRFTPADTAKLNAADPSRYGMQWSGDVAGSRLTNYLHPGNWTLYGRSLDADFLREWKLRPDASGSVEILRRFWDFPEESSKPMVPLPLVYADLLMNGDGRSLETAQLVLGQFESGSL